MFGFEYVQEERRSIAKENDNNTTVEQRAASREERVQPTTKNQWNTVCVCSRREEVWVCDCISVVDGC